MSQALVAEIRRLAQRTAADSDASLTATTSEFWRLAGQLRATLPPLLLPHRLGSDRRRFGYLVALERLDEDLAALSRVHGAGDGDIWLYFLGQARAPLSLDWAQGALELGNMAELPAARAIADADLDVLVDIEGAALAAMPLLIALRPARAIIEPRFDPAWPGAAPSRARSPDAGSGVAELAQIARLAAETSPSLTRQSPDTPARLNATLGRAIRLHQSGELDAARAEYESVLSRYATHPVAAYMLGQLLHQQHRTGAAVGWLQRAAIAAPEFRDAHYTLGQRLADSGRWAEAAAAYRHAVELTPDFAAGWSGLGLAVLHAPGDASRQAIEHLEHAVALDPAAAQWRFNLGSALQRHGKLAAAREAYKQVLARDPGHGEAHFNLGAAAQEQGDYPAAIAAYRAVLGGRPDFATAYPQLGACLQLSGQIEAWLENYRTYRAACPESLAMAVYGLEASMAAGDSAAHADWRDRILAGRFEAADPEDFTHNWEQLLFLLLHVDVDRDVLHYWYVRYDAAARALYGEPQGMPAARRPGRTRIGYLSGDLREHVMGRMIYEWVSRHDRSRFDIRLYSLASTRDTWTARFQALGVPLIDLASQPWDVASSRICDDDIDLLIDCSGHTRGGQPGILALKPARVLATHIATPGPVGLRAIDFKLTEALAEADDAQKFVVEQLLPVPAGVFPWRRYPAPGALDCATVELASGAFVCGAFVSLMKLSPRCLDLWRRILERLPRAVLAFSPAQSAWQPAYMRWLQAHGIGRERVVFIPCPTDEAGQLARYRLLDVALDPMPCGNVNGTMEALAMGVPVVTLIGLRHGERLGNALLSRFGVTDTIARDEGEYVDIVARLARDPDWAARQRDHIARRQMDSPVWDADAHVRGLEGAYDRMLAERGVLTGGGR